MFRQSTRFLRLTAMVLALSVALPAVAAPGKLLKRVEPDYPADAARSGKTGYVELEYKVGADGKVESVSVLDAQPRRVFERAAIKAVKQWEFEPGETRGKVRLDFKL